MRKLVLLITILLLPTVSTAANFDNGNTLLSLCNEFIKAVDNPSSTDIDREKVYRCGSYLTGFIAASNLYQNLLRDKGLICFPDQGVSSAKLGRTVVKYLNERPESLHINKDLLMGEAAMHAFPCK